MCVCLRLANSPPGERSAEHHTSETNKNKIGVGSAARLLSCRGRVPWPHMLLPLCLSLAAQHPALNLEIKILKSRCDRC